MCGAYRNSQRRAAHAIITTSFLISNNQYYISYLQAKRVKERHGDGAETEGILEMLMGMHKFYEKPGHGEMNTYNVDI